MKEKQKDKMPILRKPAKTGATPPDKDEIPGLEKPAKGAFSKPAPKRDAFAERYAKADPTAGAAYVPPLPGSYNALITDTAAEREDEGVDEKAWLECTIVDEGDMQGKTCRIYFNFSNDKGEEGTGMPFFRSAMQQFGYEDEFSSWEEMENTLEQIKQDQPWLIIDVKKKGKWTNIYISSVPENQNEKPDLP